MFLFDVATDIWCLNDGAMRWLWCSWSSDHLPWQRIWKLTLSIRSCQTASVLRRKKLLVPLLMTTPRGQLLALRARASTYLEIAGSVGQVYPVFRSLLEGCLMTLLKRNVTSSSEVVQRIEKWSAGDRRSLVWDSNQCYCDLQLICTRRIKYILGISCGLIVGSIYMDIWQVQVPRAQLASFGKEILILNIFAL